MIEISPAEYDGVLSNAEADLVRLGSRLDDGVEDGDYTAALLLLGIRARTLFNGTLCLIGNDLPVAAISLLRPTIEINLTIRFLNADPQLHTELWIAEGEHQALKLMHEAQAGAMFATLDDDPIPKEWFEEKKRLIAAARSKALAKSIPWMSPKPRDPLLPPLKTLAEEYGGASGKQAYTVAFRGLSPAVHTSSRAFAHGKFSRHHDGRIFFTETSEPERLGRSHRALNATVFASTLALIAPPLDLDIEAAANQARELIMTSTAKN